MKKVFLLLVAMFVAGCAQPQGEEQFVENEREFQRFEAQAEEVEVEIQESLFVDQGYLEGSIERLSELDEPTTMMDGWHNSYGANVDLIVENDDGAVMIRLAFEYGGINDLDVGSNYEYDYSDLTREGMFMTAIGCVGTSYPAWNFDRTADFLEVSVTEGNDDYSKLINFTAYWESSGYVVSGNFLAE